LIDIEVADEIAEKKSGLMKLLSSSSKDQANLSPFKAEQLTEMPTSRKFVYYTLTSTSKVKFTKFTINFSVLDSKTPLETRRKVYGQACWELVYLFVHLNHRQSVVSVIRDWYPELRAFVAKPRVLIGLEAPQHGVVIGKQRKATPFYVSPYQVVVSSERIFAIDYVHIKPSKPATIQDLFSEKCINLWKDPTPIRSWMQGKAFESRKPLFYERVVNQKSEHGMYYVDFSELKPAPDDMELYLAGENSNKSSFFCLPFSTFVTKIPPHMLTVGTRQVSFFGSNLTTFDASKLSVNYLWYLNVLVLMNNEITSLVLHGSIEKPKVMGFLNLREIHACQNKLTRLPSAIAHITTLTLLDMRKNNFSSFPTIVCSCKNLEKLDLGDNQIPSIAPEIGKLTSLRELYFNNNLLTALPVEIGRLFNLKTLMLQHNNIHKLPLIMANLTKLHTLELSGNPLVEPPAEVLAGGLNSMRSFMSDQLKSGERSFRMKLMFVGQENVGKTSVVRAMKRAISGGVLGSTSASGSGGGASGSMANPAAVAPGERPPLSTDGIDIETITMQHADSTDQSKHVLQFTVLDFAGQEIYYATHQVFLTERAIYMVVWDLRKTPKECRVDYWLHAITAAAPKSPIFLVGTHLDDKSVDPKRVLANIESLIPQYKKRFRIRGLEMVSCTAGENISAMVTNICNAALREPTMGAKFPTSHFIFEEHLQIRCNQLKEANKAPILTYEEIRDLAIDCGVIGNKSVVVPAEEQPTRARAGTYVPASSRSRRRVNVERPIKPSSSAPTAADAAFKDSTATAEASSSSSPSWMKDSSNTETSLSSSTDSGLIPDVPIHHPKFVSVAAGSANGTTGSSASSVSSSTPQSPSLSPSSSSSNNTMAAVASPGTPRSSERKSEATRSSSPAATNSVAGKGSPSAKPKVDRSAVGGLEEVVAGASKEGGGADSSDDDAVLHNTLVLFHELGSIVYLGEHLDAFIMLDPQWITKVFASVLTTKHNFAKDGLLDHDAVVTHLWGKNADFPPSLHPIMLDLLEHFQCVFKMPDFAKTNQLLVPLFLPEKKPDLALDWPIRIPGVTQYTRLYDLGYTPVGLIGRILVTLMQETIVQRFWRTGMLLYSKQERQHTALIELVEAPSSATLTSTPTSSSATTTTPSTTSTPPLTLGATTTSLPPTVPTDAGTNAGLHYRLSVTARGIGCEDLFRMLVAVVDYICSAWYHLEATDQMLVKSNFCPTCVAQGLPQPTEFTLRRCEACLSSGSIICTKNPEDWHIVRVDQVAPDIVWAEFQSKIVDIATEVTILSELGKGSNGPVYKATYNSEYVAVKSCPIIDLVDSSQIAAPASGSSSLSLPVMSVAALSGAMDELKKEVQFLSNLRHPNLVQMVGFGMTKPPTLLLEFVPLGPLSSFLSSSQFSAASARFTSNITMGTWASAQTATTGSEGAENRGRWPMVLRIAWDIASALFDLHSARPAIIHGNLSHRKVYIASSNWTTPVVAKVAFVGTARSASAGSSSLERASSPTPSSTTSSSSTSAITSMSPVLAPSASSASSNLPVSALYWTDPEVLKGGKPTTASDVYSFGIILWQLLMRLTPYSKENDREVLIAKILAGERPDMAVIPRGEPGSMNEKFVELMMKCWDVNPSQRPTFAQIVTEILPDIMSSTGPSSYNDVWEICKQAQSELHQQRKEQEALIFGSETTTTSTVQDLVLGRWIANLDTSNARVRKMLPIQSLGEVWCLTDLGNILVFSMASGQFIRRYNHVLPSISSFAFCNLFYSDDNVWVASNKVIVRIQNVKASATQSSSSTNSSSTSGSSTTTTTNSSANFDSIYGAPVEGILSIKDERYTKRAGWCRLANGVLHFYKRQGELMPWNVASITDIDVIEPHFQGHTTFLMRMKDKTIFMGGGRNATLPWQDIITKQKRDLEASRTQNGVGKAVFYCSVDQRMWAVQIVDNIAWILLNDRRLVRWDLQQSAPSGYIDLHAHMKQKGTSLSSPQQSCMVVVTTSSNPSSSSSANPVGATTSATTPAQPSADASKPSNVKKTLWVSLQTDIIRISIPEGIVMDVLHAPQGDFHPSRNEVWTYSLGLLRIRNAVTGKSQLIIPLEAPINAMTPIGSNMWLHFNRNIQIWKDYRVSSELEHRHETPVHDILYLEHNRTAWTCSVDAVNVWK
jgi:GTPase SAR1 family protein